MFILTVMGYFYQIRPGFIAFTDLTKMASGHIVTRVVFVDLKLNFKSDRMLYMLAGIF